MGFFEWGTVRAGLGLVLLILLFGAAPNAVADDDDMPVLSATKYILDTDDEYEPADDVLYIKKEKKDVRINPTNVAVIDTDVDFHIIWNQPAASHIGAATAHQTATGNGVVVAIVDGGFNTDHPALDGKLSPWAYDAVDLDFDPNDPGNMIDDDGDGIVDLAAGHGTFVAGMVLLSAPNATILPIRVVDDEGYGTIDELVRGLQFAIDANVDVINVSLEMGATEDIAVTTCLKLAWQAGIVVIASAGNDYSTDLEWLANSVTTISVAASDLGDNIAPFSNYGDKQLDIFAPGVDLWGPLGWPVDHAMAVWSGTSFSAGIVSGAAALVIELHPTLNNNQVEAALKSATDPVTDSDAGRIDLAEAVGQ